MISLGQTASPPTVEIYYQFSRLQAMTEWWHWVAFVSVIGAIAAYVVWMYRRDANELSRSTSILLAGLRLLAFAGIIFFFLDLEKRSQQRVEKPSQVAVLVDTSQSMAVTDRIPGQPTGPARMEQVVHLLEDDAFFQELRRKHALRVYRFDETEQPTLVASVPRYPRSSATQSNSPGSTEPTGRQAGGLAATAAVLGVLALISLAFSTRFRSRQETAGGEPPANWARLVATLFLLAGLVVFAVSTLLDPDLSLSQIVGLKELGAGAEESS
ncbi:MAG TPA: hypothetical protein ENJ50_07745, partial [Planctomycetaceae bacterium]|nr:hypothetical protein [Planctomycetaceae bacterium]